MPPLMDIQLSSKEAADAANMDYSNLQNWLRRSEEIGHSDGYKGIEGGGSQGIRRVFNFQGVMEIAVASRLVSKGEIGLGRALLVGRVYAYTTNNSYAGMETFGISERPPILRHAGFPFYQESVPSLKTLAYISAKGCTIVAWGGDHDPLRAIAALQGGLTPGGMIECSDVFFETCQRLGYRGFDEIEREIKAYEAYEEAHDA